MAAKNILEFLYPQYQSKQSVAGTWGPTSGVLGWLNPFSRDYGYTELARQSFNKNPSAEVNTRFNNRDFIQMAIGSTSPTNNTITTNNNTNTTTNNNTNNTTNNISGGSGGGGGGGGNPETTYVFDPSLGIMVKLSDLIKRQQDYENRVRQGIESGYSSVMSRLDQMAGLYPQWQQEDLVQLEQAYDTLKTGIDQQKQKTEQKINTYRQDVETRKKAGISEIGENLRKLLKATGMQLGAMGAGSSSASQVIAPYALSKQAARATGQVVKGANDQLAELDRKMIDVKSTYDSQINQIDMWKNDTKQQILDKYRQMKQQIDQSKIGADQARMQALVALDQSILNNVINQINQLETEARDWQRQVQQWATNRISQLQDYKIQLSQSGNFNPQQLTYEALVGLSGYPQAQGVDYFYNPFGIKRRNEIK